MDLPKKQGNRREIGGFFEIHRIRWKTPKFGGDKNPARQITRESLHEIRRGEGGRHAEIHTFIKQHNISSERRL